MGLDMYLYASEYKSRGCREEEQKEYDALVRHIQEKFVATPMPVTDGMTVEFTVMYWRKANAIHNWFVEECGDGTDNCREICVDEDDLLRLLIRCVAVLGLFPDDLGEDDPIPEDAALKASEILPPTSGFFFGSTDIDRRYLEDIRRTRDGLTKFLIWIDAEKKARGEDWSRWGFSYRTCW